MKNHILFVSDSQRLLSTVSNASKKNTVSIFKQYVLEKKSVKRFLKKIIARF